MIRLMLIVLLSCIVSCSGPGIYKDYNSFEWHASEAARWQQMYCGSGGDHPLCTTPKDQLVQRTCVYIDANGDEHKTKQGAMDVLKCED